MRFWVKCHPPRSTAQSSKKIVSTAKGPRMYTDKKGQALRDNFYALLHPFVPVKAYSGPLRLVVWYCLPLNKNEKKAVREAGWAMHDKRPDCDNLSKLFCDIMGSLGFWNDDSQIVHLSFKKFRSEAPGIGVAIEKLETLKSPLTWVG